jgi:hypothetical protein
MQAGNIIKYHNKVISYIKGTASQGVYDFSLTKIFASQGADKRDGGMLARTMWKVRRGSEERTLCTMLKLMLSVCGPEASRLTAFDL